MPSDHAWSKKIGFHAPTNRFMHSDHFKTKFRDLDFEKLSAIFDIDKLKREVENRIQNKEKNQDYFLYSLLNVSKACEILHDS